ncbi:LysE family translocator [Clostridium sp. B9]|uniref:LysE family translocator n=1 Tax=Clostridium sp. B9 TaxID=3423224 RepID=UPI003D2EF54C
MSFFYLKAILSGVVTGLLVSIPLGPAAIEAATQSLDIGFKKGFEVSLGAIAADYLYILLINFGVAQLLNLNRYVECAFWIISGLVLIIINLVFKSTQKSLDEKCIQKIENHKTGSGFMNGFLITFVNPMTLSVWMAVSAGVMSIWKISGRHFFIVALCSMFLTTLSWFILLNLMAAKGGNLIKKELTGKANTGVKYFMVILGLAFTIYGIFKIFM